MKKTAKEYVYDAINHLRKPTADIALSPIEDSDILEETYGFTKKDVCKLVDMIGIDCERDIPHAPIHAVKSVGEVVKAIETFINNTESLGGGLLILKAFAEIDKIPDLLSSLTVSIGHLHTLARLAKVNLDDFNQIKEGLLMVSNMRGITKAIDEDDSAELFKLVTREQYINTLKTSLNEYVELIRKSSYE